MIKHKRTELLLHELSQALMDSKWFVTLLVLQNKLPDALQTMLKQSTIK